MIETQTSWTKKRKSGLHNPRTEIWQRTWGQLEPRMLVCLLFLLACVSSSTWQENGCQHSLSIHLTASAIQNERRRMVSVSISKIPEKDSDWPGYGIRRSGSLTINVRKGRWFNKVFEKENGYTINIYMLHMEIISINTHSCRKPKIPHFVFLNLELKMLKNSHQTASLRQAWFIPVILS